MENTVLFTEQGYNNLLLMVKSSDKENHVIVRSILEGADMSKAIVYALLLYKEMDRSLRDDIFSDEVVEAMKPYVVIKESSFKNIDWANIIEIAIANKEACPEGEGVVVGRFAKEIEHQLVESGFEFMKNYNLFITKRV